MVDGASDLGMDLNEFFEDEITEFDFTSKQYEQHKYITTSGNGQEREESCNMHVVSIFVLVDLARLASQ